MESLGFSWTKNSVASASSTHRMLSIFQKTEWVWYRYICFNDHYLTFLEIGLKALLIQDLHDEIVIKKM